MKAAAHSTLNLRLPLNESPDTAIYVRVGLEDPALAVEVGGSR